MLVSLAVVFLLADAAPVAALPDYRPPVPQATPGASPSSHPSFAVFGNLAGQYATNTTGGERLGAAFAGSFLLGVNYTLAHDRPGDVGTMHLMLTTGFGSNLQDTALGNIESVQSNYGGGETPRLTALSYEQQTGKFDVQAGRVVMQNDFGGSFDYWGCNLLCFYQNEAIFDAAPTNNGFSYFPLSTWGTSVKVTPSRAFYALTGAYQAAPFSQQDYGQGFNLSFKGTTGVDFPLELGFKSYDREGNYNGSVRFGGYYNTSATLGAESSLYNYVEPGNPALNRIPSATYRGSSGAWILVDRLIGGSSAPNARGVAIYGTYTYSDPQTAYLSNFANAGIVVHGTFKNRPNDTIAFGWSYAEVNPRVRTFEYQLQRQGYRVPINGVEQDLELNYGIDVAQWGFFRPAIQYVVNPAGTTGGYVYPGGASGIHNALVLGFNATYLY